MRGRALILGILGLVVLGGCTTRADLIRQERRVRSLLMDQRRQIDAMKREVERLRADIEGESHRPQGTSTEARLADIEDRLARLEGAPMPVVDAPTDAPGAELGAEPAPVAPVAEPTPTTSGWRQEVTREQTQAGTVNVPERADYLALLDGLARKDCADVAPKLAAFAGDHAQSPLADDALYWAARCQAELGDQNQAVSKLYDVVTRYPSGSKAASALWTQGNLFIQMGDSPDARLAFSKLIRDYPSSDEAGLARQKLSQLEY